MEKSTDEIPTCAYQCIMVFMNNVGVEEIMERSAMTPPQGPVRHESKTPVVTHPGRMSASKTGLLYSGIV
jgi:hypothetical protein